MILRAPRSRLRPWRDDDAEAFAAMNADPAVMVDMPALDRAASDAKLGRYRAAYERLGFSRWALERIDGAFLGYVGVLPIGEAHPLAGGHEIGWRLTRAAWGHGYASEGARAALDDAFGRCGLSQVLSYTAPDNLLSQAVMGRLGLVRRADLDFTHDGWSGLVWAAKGPA